MFSFISLVQLDLMSLQKIIKCGLSVSYSVTLVLLYNVCFSFAISFLVPLEGVFLAIKSTIFFKKPSVLILEIGR